MPAQPSLEKLRSDLRRRGLPSNYVDRVIDEWADHIKDVSFTHHSKEAVMAQANSIELLGSETELAETAVLQFRARTFAGRHPVWAFIVAPLPLGLACWTVFYSALIGLVFMASPAFWRPESATIHGLTQFLFQISYELPPVAAVLIQAWLARRSGQRLIWFGAACFLVALLAASHHPMLVLPIGRDNGSLAIGFGLGYRMHYQQMLLPLAVGALCWLGMRRTHGPGDGSTPERASGEPMRRAA